MEFFRIISLLLDAIRERTGVDYYELLQPPSLECDLDLDLVQERLACDLLLPALVGVYNFFLASVRRLFETNWDWLEFEIPKEPPRAFICLNPFLSFS